MTVPHSDERSTAPTFLTHAERLTAGHACLEAALWFLGRGIAPTCCCDPDHYAVGKAHGKACTSPGKAPMHKWKDFQTTFPTQGYVNDQWQTYPIGNVGIILGQHSGVVRIDSDGAAGAALLAAWSGGDLPPTWAFASPSGGQGWLYAWPQGLPCRTTSAAAPGDHEELRLMAEGSQTIVPPSRHPSGGYYTWLPGGAPTDLHLAPAPGWLVERLRDDRATPTASRESTDTPADFARVAAAVARIPNDGTAGYDEWFNIGAALHWTGALWGRALWDTWSQQSPRFDARKQDKTWASFGKSTKRITLGTLFRMAYPPPPGMRTPPPVDDSEPWPEVPDMTGNAEAPGRRNGSTQGPRALFIPALDVQEELPVYLWAPYIPRKMATMLDGDPGIGKTGLACLLAACVSQGYPMPDQTGVPTLKPDGAGQVLLVAMEDHLGSVILPRLRRCSADLGKITFLNERTNEHAAALPFTLADLPLLAAYMDSKRPRLVYVDAIQAVLGEKVDINRANAVTAILAPLKKLAERYDCAVLCSRHPAKAGQQVAKVLYRGLGSQAFAGTVRSGLFVEDHPEDHSKFLLFHYKANADALGRTQILSKAEGHFQWCRVTRLTHGMLAGYGGPGPLPIERLKACLWLEQRLQDGASQPASHLYKEAEEQHGWSQKVLRSASEALKVTKTQIPGDFFWSLSPLRERRERSGESGGSRGSGGSGRSGVDLVGPGRKGEGAPCATERPQPYQDAQDTQDTQDTPDHPVVTEPAQADLPQGALVSKMLPLSNERVVTNPQACPVAGTHKRLKMGREWRCSACNTLMTPPLAQEGAEGYA